MRRIPVQGLHFNINSDLHLITTILHIALITSSIVEFPISAHYPPTTCPLHSYTIWSCRCTSCDTSTFWQQWFLPHTAFAGHPDVSAATSEGLLPAASTKSKISSSKARLTPLLLLQSILSPQSTLNAFLMPCPRTSRCLVQALELTTTAQLHSPNSRSWP